MRAMFRGELIVVFATCAILATARVAPIDETFALFNASGSIDSRYSDDVFEDSRLTVPELIKKYRYPVEVHTVTTSDGYILEMHRIPHGRDNNNDPNQRRPVVFVMHGLLCSSAVWVLTGPGAGLAYILAEEGYDVWMGNARGNTYSRHHTTLNPDAVWRTTFWQFSWDEIGNNDLPAMIDFALQHTGRDKLHYVGHSQGTTAFFVMGSLRPEYNDKIISMHALAPVAYMAHNKSPLLQFLSPHANNIERFAALMGVGEFLPNNAILTWAGQAACQDEVVFQPICSNIFFLLGGWNEAQHNATLFPVILGHVPAGAAVRQFAHYAQGISGKEFRRYDYGNIISNRRAYGTFRPPHYNLNRITSPVFLHYSDNDPLAHVKDVDRLYRELGRPIGKFLIETFTHIDFMWAIDVKGLLYDKVIKLIAEMDAAEDTDISNH